MLAVGSRVPAVGSLEAVVEHMEQPGNHSHGPRCCEYAGTLLPSTLLKHPRNVMGGRRSKV